MSDRTEIRFLVKDGHVVDPMDLPADFLGKTGQEALHWPSDQEKDQNYQWMLSDMADQDDGSTLCVFTRTNQKAIIAKLMKRT